MLKQIKTFFVDDEPIVISDLLAQINWEEQGFDVRGCAYSAEVALTLIKKYRPDLVFVDVALPGTSGLELAAKIKEINSNAIIIILSGYMEFDYAQQALNIGVLTYLVKHQLTAQTLLETLNKVKETFETQTAAVEMIRKQLLSQLLGGKLTCDGLRSEQKEYLEIYSKPFQIMGFRPWAPYFYRNDPQWQVKPEMEEILASEQQEGFQILDTVIHQNMIVAFLKITNDHIGSKALMSTAHHCCVAIKEYLHQKTGIPFAAAYQTQMSGLQKLESDANQLAVELERSIFNQNQIGAARLISNRTQSDYSYLTKSAFISDYDRCMKKIKEDLEAAWRNKRLTDFNACTEKILQLLKALNIDLHKSSGMAEQVYSAQEVSDYLLKTLQRARRFSEIKEEYSATTIYVLEYINANYNKNPTINEVAGKLNSSGMYLGQKIKKETGRTFNDFLTECRMYHAEALMAETNLKISEISREIGISNSQYFRKIFQEFTGQSPNDYRKQLLLK